MWYRGDENQRSTWIEETIDETVGEIIKKTGFQRKKLIIYENRSLDTSKE